MKIDKILKNKALPSFCTSNIDVIETILFFCHIKKLPCLIESTSNQVNQHGGYTNKTPKIFVTEILNLKKKIKFNSKKIFLGGDHLGPLPWGEKNKSTAMKNSISLINDYLTNDILSFQIKYNNGNIEYY